MLRRDDDSVLRVALDLKVGGKSRWGQPNKSWKKQVNDEGECPESSKVERRVRAIAEGMG